MFILTIKGREKEGAYSVIDEEGDQVLYLFEEEDDAIRFAMMLEEEDHPEMHILEVDDDIMIKTCKITHTLFEMAEIALDFYFKSEHVLFRIRGFM